MLLAVPRPRSLVLTVRRWREWMRGIKMDVTQLDCFRFCRCA